MQRQGMVTPMYVGCYNFVIEINFKYLASPIKEKNVAHLQTRARINAAPSYAAPIYFTYSIKASKPSRILSSRQLRC